jgi:glycerol kinase
LLDSVVAVAAAAVGRAGVSRVDAVGLANQGETTVAWDARSGEPLAPAIVWQDRRTEAFLADLAAGGSGAEIERASRLPLDPYFSAAKIAWLLQQPPVAAAAAAGRLRIGTTDAFFRARLTGRFETEPATASRTQLLDLEALAWHPDLCRAFGVDRATLPTIVATAAELGDTAVGPLRAAIVDQQAALAGQGCFEKGEAKCTYGTGCFLLVNTGSALPRSTGGLLPTVAWTLADETAFALDGGVLSAGTVVDWLASIGLLPAPEELDRLAASVADSGGVRLLPALAGMGAPWWRGSARGVLAGLGTGTEGGHIARAALEGIAFAVRDLVEAAAAATGTALPRLRVDGGLARSRALLQAQADVLGIPLLLARHRESTALGVAALAGLSLGVFAAPEEVVSLLPDPERIEPVWSEDRRQEAYANWRQFAERAIEI